MAIYSPFAVVLVKPGLAWADLAKTELIAPGFSIVACTAAFTRTRQIRRFRAVDARCNRAGTCRDIGQCGSSALLSRVA